MSESYDFYFNAAKALWDTPLPRLEELRATGRPDPLKRAADTTLRIKAEFMTPDSFNVEGAAVNKLAAALRDDPGFTAEVAKGVTGGAGLQARKGPPVRRTAAEKHSRSQTWRVAIWIIAGTAAILLLLEIIAIAGFDVANPIGNLIEILQQQN